MSSVCGQSSASSALAKQSSSSGLQPVLPITPGALGWPAMGTLRMSRVTPQGNGDMRMSGVTPQKSGVA